MWGTIGTVVATVGANWVSKLLSGGSQDVSPYFSGNGEYLDNVNRQKGIYNTTFSKYASQLPEDSPEAVEYLAISRPALEWMGQRNAIPTMTDTLESEGLRLVNEYEKRTAIIEPTTDLLSTLQDPLNAFFSLFKLNQNVPQTEYLGYPKTDTLIPIISTTEEEEKTGFEKIGMPVIIAVISGFVLFTITRR